MTRVSTNMMQRLAVNAMLDRQAALSKTQQQLATGRRILTPAEDPSASTQALFTSQQIKQTEQFQVNANRALARLEIEETTLISFGDSLQRVRELAVKGLNSSNGAEDRISIAAEVRQKLDELLALANSQDGTGEYLFSGYQSTTQPFVDAGGGTYNYQGDQGQRRLQISPTRQAETSDPGSKVFVDIPHNAGGSQNIFQTVFEFAVSLEANTPDGNILTDVDAALDKMFTVRAEIGARLNAIEAQQNINDQFSTQMEGVLSEIQDLDYAEAVGRLNLQLTGLQAAQQSFQRVQGLSLFNYL